MDKVFEKKELIKKSQDFSGWYNDVILKAGLADYAPVKGCMVIKPYGFSIWENIQRELDKRIKEAGVKNAYFPLFIPYSFLKKEKEHVRGFSPELAIVTHGGGKKLPEPLVVRPTSETIMYEMFSRWIKSWRDLPLLVNQWCNVVRWEKRTYLFLRTSEFLWQEGHTVHRSEKEAREEAIRALKMYRDIDEKVLALPVLIGKKSESEKFPGAKITHTLEVLVPSGKALQCGTSHELGQNFSKVFNIKFQDKNGKFNYGWQTSWGMTTRIIGALIMAHGDDQGLILPPKIAPVQVVIIPIAERGKTDRVKSFSYKIKETLEKDGIRVEVDDREQYSIGWKFNEWELKGVPLRLEIGKEEMSGNCLTAVRRDTMEKSKMKIRGSEIQIRNLLDEIQTNLYEKAKKFLKENSHRVKNYQEFKETMKNKKGFVWAFWCGKPNCEKKIKEETKATTRLLSIDSKKEKGRCIYCGKVAHRRWIFGTAY